MVPDVVVKLRAPRLHVWDHDQVQCDFYVVFFNGKLVMVLSWDRSTMLLLLAAMGYDYNLAIWTGGHDRQNTKVNNSWLASRPLSKCQTRTLNS